MKTLFFSAIESPNLIKETNLQDVQVPSEPVDFNTPCIMNPHDVLSAIKVSLITHFYYRSFYTPFFYCCSRRILLIGYQNFKLVLILSY